MKKILFALVAMCMVLVSCNKNTDPVDDPTGDDCTFVITVSDVTAHEAEVVVTPSDLTAEYLCMYAEAANFEGSTDDEVIDALYDYVDQMITMYAQYGYELAWADFVVVDETEMSLDELTGSTTYEVYATKVDSVELTHYTLGRKSFTTGEADPDEAFADEPKQTTTLTFAPTAVTIQYAASYGYFMAEIDGNAEGFTAMLFCYYDGTSVDGTYNVSDSEEAGTLLKSEGTDGYYYYYSMVAALDEEGYLDTESGVYFIDNGSMTVDAQNGISATLGTHFGSTISINYTGEVTLVDAEASSKPARIAARKNAPRFYMPVVR